VDGSARYRAFISYSHRDAKWAEWLHRRLETYQLPRNLIGRDTPFGPVPERLQPIFRDRDELGTATDLSTEITAALQESMFLIVLCSPAAAASTWVNEEVRAFKRMHGESRVRAIIVDGQPFAADPTRECFPGALRFRVGVDGVVSDVPAEPMAADLRPGGDGKKYAVSKLVAGLTGTRLDELVQRESHRRSRRLRALAAGLAALVILFAGLALEAWRQRNVARVAQTAAEAARKEAEGLVEFMLTDLRTRLEAVGRLDVLDSVGDRALAYYDARDLAQADPDALGRRARAQLLVGEIDNLRGDLDAALAAYEAAAATTQEQLSRDPRNPQRIFDHAQAEFWIGYIAWQRGDLDRARQQFTRYHDHARDLLTLEPGNVEWQKELGYAYSNLGTLAWDQGDAVAAETYFRQALAVSGTILQGDSTDVERLVSHGDSYAWLADALIRQAKVAAARDARLAQLELYASLDQSEPDNALIRTHAAVASYRLAQIELAAGELQQAAVRADAAARTLEQLLATEPGNLEQADRASMAHALLGEAQLHLGLLEPARASLSRSIEIAEHLVARDGNVAQWRDQNLALPRITLAHVQAQTGSVQAARSLFAAVANDLRDSIARERPDPRTLRSYCAALAGQARLDGNDAGLWREIAAILSRQQAILSPEGLVLLAEAYAALGELTAADAITASLVSTGFRHPDLMAVLQRHPALGTSQVAAAQ
jgi:tetratricopeptide (TPR) repeat protein